MDSATIGRATEVRKFNRFYTNVIGLVNQTILGSSYSLAEVRVLLEILLAGQTTATDLTKLLAIDAGYLSRMLRRFARDKMLEAARSTVDRRVYNLSLTDKGRGIIGALVDASTREIVAMLEKMPDARQEKLVGHMAAIRAIMDPQAGDAVAIRPHRAGDAGYIAYRHAVLYQAEYGLDQVFERYDIQGMAKFFAAGADGEIWVADDAGQVVGAIAIVAAEGGDAQLRWFYLEPEYRGRGLGRRLMSVALDYCRQRRFERVFLWTFRGLDAACHLYGVYGFTPGETQENNTWREKLVEERWDLALAAPGQ